VDPCKGKGRKFQAMDITLLRRIEGRIRRDRIRSDIFRQEYLIQNI
jgi:hypothetical protein